MNKKILLFSVILGLLMVGLSSALMDIVLTSPDNITTTDRRPEFVYTAVTENSTAINCNLTIGDTTQAVNVEVENNTEYTQTALRLPDGVYAWNVSCRSQGDTDLNHTNTSATWRLNVSFATYSGADVAPVSIDMFIGIMSAIFGLVGVIVVVLMFRWIKGNKKLIVLK